MLVGEFINTLTLTSPSRGEHTRIYIQKYPDWTPGAITANGTALCH
jgi:hypothetical protein